MVLTRRLFACRVACPAWATRSGLATVVGATSIVLGACASSGGASLPAVSALSPGLALVGARGEPLDAQALARAAPYTVFVFFSPECHCLTAHEPRLRALVEADQPRGVQFFMVDSEGRGSLERDAAEARARRYPFPILGDRAARLADALGARFATYAVVVDAEGDVRYRGGIDSDKTHLHDDATPYLKNALDDLLAGGMPRLAEGKTLGCALEKW